MSDELELKYAVSDMAALEDWLDQHFAGPSPQTTWREATTVDRYFDTADGALARAGHGARLRTIDGETKVTLKTDVALTDGVHHRRELEALAAPTLDAADWPASDVRDRVLRLAGGQPLEERFALRQLRRVRDWHADQGSCQFSLDRVEVLAHGEQRGRLNQLEVELIEGERVLLLRVAQRLTDSRLLTPERRSKMAIAAELFLAAGHR